MGQETVTMRRAQSPKQRPSRRAVATRPGRQCRPRTISEETWALIAELDEKPDPVLWNLIARVARGELIHGHPF
jgi:hypothetical protein